MWIGAFCISTNAPASEKDSLSVAKSQIRIVGNAGLSSNYAMGVYSNLVDRDGLANIINIGLDFGIRLADHITLYGGCRYRQVGFRDNDIDSSFFSSTGVVTYKQANYIRKNLGIQLGVAFPFRIKKLILSPELSASRQIVGRQMILDEITGSNSQLYSSGKEKGFMFSISLLCGYVVFKQIGLWAGYSLMKSTEYLFIPRSCSACGDGYIDFPGSFHSLSMMVSYNFSE